MAGIEQTSPAALAFDLANCRLADFRFVRRLGQRTPRPGVPQPGFYGVNGAVYLVALRAHPDMYYALKICLNLDPSNVASADLLARFQSEYEVQSREDRMPRHQNVLRVLSVFTADIAPGDLSEWDFDPVVAPHSVVAVMEYVPMTLSQVITVAHVRAPPYFTNMEVLMIAAGLMAGVNHMNAHRVVHRDLKPDNVLLSDDRRVIRIADFGCCLDCRADHLKGFLMPFALRGTSRGGAFAYMAPEVASAEAGPDVVIDYAKSDVFSAGLILHRMLSGDWPFPTQDARTYTAANYRPLPAVYSEAVRRVIDRMLALDPDQRHSASEAYAWVCAALAEEQARETREQSQRDRDALLDRLLQLEREVRETREQCQHDHSSVLDRLLPLEREACVGSPNESGYSVVCTVEGVTDKIKSAKEERVRFTMFGRRFVLHLTFGETLAAFLQYECLRDRDRRRGDGGPVFDEAYLHDFTITLLHPSDPTKNVTGRVAAHAQALAVGVPKRPPFAASPPTWDWSPRPTLITERSSVENCLIGNSLQARVTAQVRRAATCENGFTIEDTFKNRPHDPCPNTTTGTIREPFVAHNSVFQVALGVRNQQLSFSLVVARRGAGTATRPHPCCVTLVHPADHARDITVRSEAMPCQSPAQYCSDLRWTPWCTLTEAEAFLSDNKFRFTVTVLVDG